MPSCCSTGSRAGTRSSRRQGIRLVSVLTLEVLLTYLRSSGKIGEDWYRKSMTFFDEHRGRDLDAG